MRHVNFLRFVDIPQQRSGGGDRLGRSVKPRGSNIRQVKLPAYARGALGIFIVVAAHLEHTAELFTGKIGYGAGLGGRLVHDKLTRGKAAELV